MSERLHTSVLGRVISIYFGYPMPKMGGSPANVALEKEPHVLLWEPYAPKGGVRTYSSGNRAPTSLAGYFGNTVLRRGESSPFLAGKGASPIIVGCLFQ